MMRSRAAVVAIFICLGFLSAPPCHADPTPEEITRVLAFDVSSVPEADELLDALSKRPQYATPEAQYQALAGVIGALTDFQMFLSMRTTKSPEVEASIDRFSDRIDAKKTAYGERFRELQAALPPRQIKSHSIRLAILTEYVPQYGEIFPHMITLLEEHIYSKAVGERSSPVPLGIFGFATLLGLIVLKRQTSTLIADKDFEFNIISEIAEVMQERQRSETEVSGTISGGGSYASGMNYPISGSTWSTTTRFQEIFIKMENGKERVLDFVDFKVPCREGNILSILALQRSGSGSRGCAIHNHTTEETQIFRNDIRSAILPTDSNMHYVGWWIFLSLFSAAMAWFGGIDFKETSLLAAVITGGILGAVLTVCIRFIVRFLRRLNSGKQVPGVVAKIQEKIEQNERELNAASGTA